MNGRRIGFGLFTLAMVAFLIGLGLWQLQRRTDNSEHSIHNDLISMAPATARLIFAIIVSNQDTSRRILGKAQPHLTSGLKTHAGFAYSQTTKWIQQ